MAGLPQRECPDCGRPIPPDAVRGLCLACVVRVSLPGLIDDPPPPAVAAPVRRIGPWEIVRLAGEGAFGLVYEAVQRAPLHRRAALKVLKPGHDSPEVRLRFAAEREALTLLDHPGIARVLDAGESDGRPWLASEWVEGARPITDHCRERRLPREARLRLFQTVCEAVAHAHRHGIIHRDLTPANILVGKAGEAKVIDFGIARATEHILSEKALATMAGQVLGTPAYMSPEQAAGWGGEADTRSDIYSLGAILYELLCGQPPFPPARLGGVPLTEALRLVREEAPPAPSVIDAALRGGLEWITLKALEKDPARRYETAAALGRDVGRWLQGDAVQAAPPSTVYRLGKFLRRHRTAAAGAASVVVSLVAGLAGTTLMSLRAREQSDRAVRGEAAARRAASRGDHQTAQAFFDRGQAVAGVMHLARAVRTDPTNHAAAERLIGELLWSDFPRLARPPVAFDAFIRHAAFSPDGAWVGVLSHEMAFAPGALTLIPRDDGPAGLTIPDGVHHFAFSPDGRTVAAAHAGGAVTFWRAADGRAEASVAALGHGGPVRHVAWISATRLVTVEDRGETASLGRLWSAPDGRGLAEVPDLHALAVPAVSPDARQIAWADHRGRVVVHDAETGSVVASWQAEGRGTLAYCHGSDHLALQVTGGPLQVHDARTGAPVGPPMRSSSSPLTLATDAGRSLITAGFDGVATLWQADRQVPVVQFPGRFDTAVVSRGGALAALGGDLQDPVLLWDLDRQRPARASVTVPGHALALAVSPDGRWLAAGGRQRRLSLYDLQPRAARPEVYTLAGPLWHCGWSRDGSRFAALGTRGAFALWQDGAKVDSATLGEAWAVADPAAHADGLRRHEFAASTDPGASEMVPPSWLGPPSAADVRAAALSPDGTRLVLATAATAHVVDIAAPPGAPPRVVPLPHPPAEIAVSNAQAAAALADGSIIRIPLDGAPAPAPEPRHPAQPTALAWLPDGRLASGAENGELRLRPDGPPLRLSAAPRQLAISPDGRWLAVGLADASAVLVDLATGSTLGAPMRHSSVVGSAGLLLRFAPGGTLLATGGSHDNTVRLWEVPSGRERAVLPHGSNADTLAFDSTGRRLAVVFNQGDPTSVLQVWDVESALPLMPPCFLPAGDGHMAVCFHPDGTRVAVAGGRHAVFLFTLPPLLPAAPPWLAAAAESFAGWRFDPAGLAAPAPAWTAPSPAADPWAAWFATSPDQRPLAPLATQSPDAYLRALRSLGSLDALREINQFRPSALDRLALKLAEELGR